LETKEVNRMKYVFLFCGTMEDNDAFKSLTPEELGARYAKVGQWFAEHGARMGPGNQLQGPETATTVSWENGKPIVKDGLFMESKELVGGYTEVDVADLDEALAMARTWPGGGTVEIRPVIAR
jgi:hypothetical protein